MNNLVASPIDRLLARGRKSDLQPVRTCIDDPIHRRRLCFLVIGYPRHEPLHLASDNAEQPVGLLLCPPFTYNLLQLGDLILPLQCGLV